MASAFERCVRDGSFVAITLATVIGFVSAVRAETGDPVAEPVRIRFDAPAGCPDAARFFDEVRARTRHVRAAAGDEPARLFRVSVTRGYGAIGTLVVEGPTEASRPRTVRGTSCEEVVNALAWSAALAIDPDARPTPAAVLPTGIGGDAAVAEVDVDARGGLDGGARAPSLVASPPAEDAGTDADAGGDADVRASVPLPPPAPPREPSRASPPSEPSPPHRWTRAAGAMFDLVGAGAPSAVVGASVFVRADRDPEALFGPSFRPGVAVYGHGRIDAGSGAARFTWWVGRLDACPLHLWLGSRVVAEPCASVEVGALVTSASGVANEQGHARLWASAGAIGHLAWRIAGPVALEGQAGVRVPLTRDSFVFNPNEAVYVPPHAMLVGGIGLGVSFP